MPTMSPYVRSQRLAKVIALETYIRVHLADSTVEQLRAADGPLRVRIARAAGVNPPSTETWKLLCLLMAGEQLPDEYR